MKEGNAKSIKVNKRENVIQKRRGKQKNGVQKESG